MRENIGLFRGKRIDNGNWISGSLFTTINDYYIIPLPIITSKSKVDPDSIGECTGLKDKNGKLIFEGDILKNTLEDGFVQYLMVIYDIKDYCWKVMNQWQMAGCLQHMIGEIEIIGNIHDNPELLKGGEG